MAIFTSFGSCRLKRSKAQKAVLHAELIRLKEAVQQAERKSMNKSMAFHEASHDLRNGLHGIIELIKQCHAEITPSSELAGNLTMMNKRAVVLLDTLNTALDTSRVESGKIRLKQDAFDICRIIENSVDSFNVLAEKRGLEMVWDPCDFSVLKLGKVIGDRQRVNQVLDNLLGNAVKFTSEGKIIVRVWASKPNFKISSISSDYGCSISHMLCCLSRRFLRHLRRKSNQQGIDSRLNDPNSIELTFEVDDTGIGIPIEKRASIFENYVQVDEHSPQGTGLGLGIVQSVVRLMGGEISIQDKQPGEKGTCFKFSIFLGSDDTSKDEETNGSITSEPFVFNESHTVNVVHSLLFVEGSETKRILRTWMESLGIKVWTAQQVENISPTLQKIKHSINSSTKSESALFCKTFSRKADGVNSEGFSHIREKATLCSELPLRILVIVDLSNGDLSEILSSLTEFVERNTNLYCKIACITDSKVTKKDLSKFRSLPCNLTLRRPIHGSRLHELFELIQELGKAEEEVCVDRAEAGPSAEPQIEKQPAKHSEITEDVIRIENEKPLSGKRVLLVEDDEIMRKIGSRTLSQLGAEVEFAKNGLEALDLVKETLGKGFTRGKRHDYYCTYDAIFMDCQMPVMDGYEATRQIREEECRYGTHVPITALSMDASDEDVQKTSAAGMDHHVEKPLTVSKVINVGKKLGLISEI